MRARVYADIAERVIWTALQAFLATWLITARFDAVAFKIAGVAAVVAAAKCVVATRVGDSDSAATLPDSG